MNIKVVIRVMTFCLIGYAVCSCKNNDTPAPVEFIRDVAPFPIGAAVDYALTRNNTSYIQVLTTEHNSITAENSMKLSAVHPSADRYDFTESDFLVGFAQAQSKRVHGHALLWYRYQEVSWVNTFPGDSAAWEKMMKDHIQTEVSHFKGKVASWDVVNEAFNDGDGTLRVMDTDASSFDNGCIYARKVGKDYIARAFQYAHEADPDVLLFYNEYGQEYNAGKLQSILNMVADFKKRSIPIHGIGIQFHINVNTSNAGIENALRQLAATGLKIHISELDISVNPDHVSSFAYSDALQDLQASKFEFVVRTYRTLVPAGQQYGITTWNVGDADSWLRRYFNGTDYPLLFNDVYLRKKTYTGFLNGLKN